MKKGRDIMARININMADELLEELDSQADKMHLNRTAVIITALNQYLMSFQIKGLMVDMSVALNTIAEKGEVSKQDMKKLDEFNLLCKMILGEKS